MSRQGRLKACITINYTYSQISNYLPCIRDGHNMI